MIGRMRLGASGEFRDGTRALSPALHERRMGRFIVTPPADTLGDVSSPTRDGSHTQPISVNVTCNAASQGLDRVL